MEASEEVFPNQNDNGTECGVFMLLGMKAVALDENGFQFCLSDSSEARKKIGIDILRHFGTENYKLDN